MTATITPIRSRRHATPERWQAALKRAFAEGVQVRQLATSGVWIATSGTNPDAAYVTTGAECECPAGANGDPICKHRAAYWHMTGALDLDPEPEPLPPALAVSPEQMDVEDAAYARGIAAGARLHLGLVARELADVRDWAMVSDPVARAYGRGACEALTDRLAA